MSAVLERNQLRQRSDFTYKFNTKTGRHGWLRLTPAYSLKLVEDLVVHAKGTKRVFDPFCGTGTTALCAAYHGHEGVTTDINPFLLWLATAKTQIYSVQAIANTRTLLVQALAAVQSVQPVSPPPLANIERWWSPGVLDFLCRLRASIADLAEIESPERTLLLVGFCRTLIELSNAAFNHQSMSFKEAAPDASPEEMMARYTSHVDFVLSGAAENPGGSAEVVLGDSRDPRSAVKGKFDLVITSPPYANRMSYIRELRPYMYWLGFLEDARAAGELDWTAIGGTWGVATSRLTGWARPVSHFRSNGLVNAIDAIAHADNKNGALLANYVAKYFDDMWSHFQGLTAILNRGCELHYIVGNSTFYGNLVPTEQFYAEMLCELGFTDVECVPIRKRNSNKNLVEYDVVARWK